MNTALRTHATLGRHLLLVALIAATAGHGLALAQSGRVMITPDEVPWTTAGTAGVGTSGAAEIQAVVLKGDPEKAGLYTLLLRVGPNVRIQSHSHGDDRVVTVLTGTWHFGYGDRFDEAALQALGPGSFYTEPPDETHFAMTKEDVVIVQIVGTGPSSTTYVDPEHEPPGQ